MADPQGKSLIQRAKAFDQIDRLWADERFDDGRRYGHELRAFITGYLVARARHGDHKAAFEEALAHVTGRYLGVGHMWRMLLQEDAPRYTDRSDSRRGCPVVKTRGKYAGKPCGRYQSFTARVTNIETGEWTLEGWCRAHEAAYRTMRAREQTLTNVPEPLPNIGGLLPSYLTATNWPDLYDSACYRWKPPYVGIIADQWPVMAKVATAPLMKVSLSLVAGGSQPAETSGPIPSLRLVKGDAS